MWWRYLLLFLSWQQFGAWRHRRHMGMQYKIFRFLYKRHRKRGNPRTSFNTTYILQVKRCGINARPFFLKKLNGQIYCCRYKMVRLEFDCLDRKLRSVCSLAVFSCPCWSMLESTAFNTGASCFIPVHEVAVVVMPMTSRSLRRPLLVSTLFSSRSKTSLIGTNRNADQKHKIVVTLFVNTRFC